MPKAKRAHTTGGKRAVRAKTAKKKTVKARMAGSATKRPMKRPLTRKAKTRAKTNAKKSMRKASRTVRQAAVPKKAVVLRKPVPTRMPKAGEMAPDFTLPDANGSLVHLYDLRGRKIVLYFYPKDDTPGCTLEAKAFSADYDIFLAKGAIILGVSKDTCESHRAFMQKHGLSFMLLSDVTGETVERYGCWTEKSLYGKTFMGVQRATFIIDENGRLLKTFPRVTPEGHSKDVLDWL